MNNKLSHISNILNDYFKEDKISKLIEKQENMSIDFISENQKFLSFSFDKQLSNRDFPKGLFPFFNRGEAGVCAFCDYIIFTEKAGQLYILLIELKKGKDNVTKQLNAGQCFAEYIISTLNRVYNANVKPQIRQISIRERHIKPKQKQKEIQYTNNFCTFSDSKFWLKKYLI
ncbi:hypothetical protein [Chryseobacterium taihuense]|nr:hypothetical protein [Chryseobacterium taihuense]